MIYINIYVCVLIHTKIFLAGYKETKNIGFLRSVEMGGWWTMVVEGRLFTIYLTF